MKRKKHQRKPRRAPEIPVNSFADIAFLLIIFFLVAATIERMTGTVTELPTGETSQQEQPDKTPTVQIHDRRMIFEDRDVNVEELRRGLARLKLHERADDDRVVALEATGDVDYQTYFDAMCTISAAGGVMAIVKEDTEGGGDGS